ncbi:kinase-like domain-containing protein [Infundibulicybe gibba]|nr:kinase-like domain-containing protein [Infundibulicybe gibba]
MPPSRSTRSARRPSPISPTQLPQQPPIDNPSAVTIDGLTHGWQYKIHYRGTDIRMSPQSSDPRITRPTSHRPPPLKLGDLRCVRTLGKGEYGHVLLVEADSDINTSGDCFALKVLSKKLVRKLDQIQPHSKDVERSRLVELPWNPFISGMVQVFHDPKNLYLMLELIPCGSLRSIIQERAPLDPLITSFYFSNIVCGLSFLEDHGVVHRDLKPENILLGPDGYLCLADFGTAAKEEEETHWLLIGSPAYMAPESITPVGQVQPHGTAIDWWSGGCILYEMITRKMPFLGHTTQGTYKKALAAKLKWPPEIPVGKTLKDLVSSLLTVDAAERLGGQGAIDVRQHPWLNNVDWEKVQAKEYLAPFIPPRPDHHELWHREPLPKQQSIPDLPIVAPPLYLAHDDRFPPKIVF